MSTFESQASGPDPLYGSTPDVDDDYPIDPDGSRERPGTDDDLIDREQEGWEE